MCIIIYYVDKSLSTTTDVLNEKHFRVSRIAVSTRYNPRRGRRNRGSHNAKTIVWRLEKLGVERKYASGSTFSHFFIVWLYLALVYLRSCVHRPP